MAIDYVELADDVRQLIEDNGRSVSLTKAAASTPADPNKPWRGNDPAQDTTIVATAILVPYEEDEVDDSLVHRSDQRCLLAADSTNVQGQDVESFDTLDDSGVTGVWKIESVEVIQPGDTAIVYDIQLRR